MAKVRISYVEKKFRFLQNKSICIGCHFGFISATIDININIMLLKPSMYKDFYLTKLSYTLKL